MKSVSNQQESRSGARTCPALPTHNHCTSPSVKKLHARRHVFSSNDGHDDSLNSRVVAIVHPHRPPHACELQACKRSHLHKLEQSLRDRTDKNFSLSRGEENSTSVLNGPAGPGRSHERTAAALVNLTFPPPIIFCQSLRNNRQTHMPCAHHKRIICTRSLTLARPNRTCFINPHHPDRAHTAWCDPNDVPSDICVFFNAFEAISEWHYAEDLLSNGRRLEEWRGP